MLHPHDGDVFFTVSVYTTWQISVQQFRFYVDNFNGRINFGIIYNPIHYGPYADYGFIYLNRLQNYNSITALQLYRYYT